MELKLIRTVVVDNNQNSLNQVSSLIKEINETEFTGGFSSFQELFNIDLKNIELVIFDISTKNAPQVLTSISKIKNENENILFIALSSEMDSNLILQLEEKGIKNFILKPLMRAILEANIKKFSKYAKTITLFSLKKGTGKTTALANIAFDVLSSDKKVCIMDFNSESFDVSKFLDIKDKCDFEFILNNFENLDKNSLLEKIPHYKNTNLHVFSSPKNKDSTKILNGLKNIFDYIFVDLPSNIDEKTISILNNVDLIVLVGLFDVQQTKNLQQCYELFNKIGYNELKVKLLINRTLKDSCHIIEEIEKILNKKVDFKIPNNYLTLTDAINRASLTEETNPQSNIAKSYQRIAEEISNINFDEIRKTNKNETTGMFDLVKRMGE